VVRHGHRPPRAALGRPARQALRLVLTSAQVGELGIRRRCAFQIRITGLRPAPYYYLNEQTSYLIVEDRYE